MALLEKIIYGVSKKLDGISGIALVAMDAAHLYQCF